MNDSGFGWYRVSRCGMDQLTNKKIAIIVSTPMTAAVFLRDQIRALSLKNDVTLIANFSSAPHFVDFFSDISIKNIKIHRKVNPFLDLSALWSVYCFLRREQFDLVHTVSPKAGLLGMLSAVFAGVNVRLHTFTGQVWATKLGVSRLFLKALDSLIAYCSTAVLIDSHSQKEFLVVEGVVKSGEGFVLGDGSISGVDLVRFSQNDGARDSIRSQLGVVDSDILLLFLGRLKAEKGVLELAEAFACMAKIDSRIKLLYVGPDEDGIKSKIQSAASAAEPNVFFVPYTSTPEQYMSAADIFCLPSYREGFGSVVIEAASCGLTTIASNIYGLSDAVDDGVTGLLVLPKNVDSLLGAIKKLSADKGLRDAFADAARERAHTLFSHQRLTNALLVFYKEQFSCRVER